jgi:hypothetical protein
MMEHEHEVEGETMGRRTEKLKRGFACLDYIQYHPVRQYILTHCMNYSYSFRSPLPDLRRSAIYHPVFNLVCDRPSVYASACLYTYFEPCIHRARHAYHLLFARGCFALKRGGWWAVQPDHRGMWLGHGEPG